MGQKVRYLTHPQVIIDPAKDIRRWSLSDEGRHRLNAIDWPKALRGTTVVISSTETKAFETARPLANALNCPLETRELMHENDRSSTGFLPPAEFERTADQFFANPDHSVRGWETASAAQARIVSEVDACLKVHQRGDILFVGHGAVGTLLYCHLASIPIDRKFDQGPNGGGCFFTFDAKDRKPLSHWRPIEDLI